MFTLRKINGHTVIAHVIPMDMLGINASMIGTTIRSTREFIVGCRFDSKENYLEWVANYKRINAILTLASQRLKSLRRPFRAVTSPEFTTMVQMYGFKHPGVSKSLDSHLYEFEKTRTALLRAIGVALTELYAARYAYKLASSVVADRDAVSKYGEPSYAMTA